MYTYIYMYIINASSIYHCVSHHHVDEPYELPNVNCWKSPEVEMSRSPKVNVGDMRARSCDMCDEIDSEQFSVTRESGSSRARPDIAPFDADTVCSIPWTQKLKIGVGTHANDSCARRRTSAHTCKPHKSIHYSRLSYSTPRDALCECKRTLTLQAL